MFAERCALGEAIDRGAGSENQVIGPGRSASLQNVQEAADIRLDVDARIFDAVTHPCLCSKVDDPVNRWSANSLAIPTSSSTAMRRNVKSSSFVLRAAFSDSAADRDMPSSESRAYLRSGS